MLQSNAVLVLHENIKSITMDLNLQGYRFLPKHEWNLRQRKGDWLSPYSLLFVVYNQLSTSLKLSRVEMEQHTVEIIMTGTSNIDTEKGKW